MTKLKQSFLILAAAEIIYNASSYVINMGLGRILGVADYGRYSLVIGFTTMLIIFVGRGVPTAMAKRISENIGNTAKILAIKAAAAKMQILIIAALTALFYICAPLIARAFGDPSLTALFHISAFVIPAFALSSFHVLYFNGLKFFKAMTALKISRGIFRMLWIVGLAYTLQLEGAIIGAIAAPLSVLCIALLIEWRFLREKPKTAEVYPWKKISSYAGGFMAFLIFYEFYVRTDIYMIKTLTGSDFDTGLYTAAMTIALIPYYALFALTFILFPTMSELVKNGKKTEIKKILTKVIGFLLAALIPTALIMGFLASPIITLLYGSEYAPGAFLIPLMCGGTVFGTIFYVLASVFNGADMTRVPASIAAFAILFSITANIIYLPQYGIMATAMIFSSTSTFMGITALIIAYKTFIKTKKHEV